jgi:phosphoribosylanthranilate isomerase
MEIRTKICGITTREARDAAVEGGADFIGFVLYPPSPRHLEPERAAALREALPPHVRAVAVLVNPEDALLERVVTHLRPDFLQLHGQETPRRTREIRENFGIPLIRAVGVHSSAGLDAAEDFYPCSDMLLFDAPARDEKNMGGTGLSFDWAMLAVRRFPLPWFLSGGLHAGNVAEAVRASGAGFVDVSSGVESTRGVKDAEKIRAFLSAVAECSA